MEQILYRKESKKMTERSVDDAMINKIKKNKTMVKKLDRYPGVRFDDNLGKWIATCRKQGIVHVATKNTFEQAKSAMIGFEKI